MIHLSACSVRFTKLGKWVDCVAVLSDAGVSDVISFIKPDGKPYNGKTIWEYNLCPSKGAISIPC